MPVHDWTLVDAGTFHAFHTAWITHLSETLNGGVLPGGYYAMPEQHAGRWIPYVLTLQMPVAQAADQKDESGVAVADAPPRVREKLTMPPSARGIRRTLVIRHVSGHRIVALLEVVSPANKDRHRMSTSWWKRLRARSPMEFIYFWQTFLLRGRSIPRACME